MENIDIINLIYINKHSISPELCNDIITIFEQEPTKKAGCVFSGVNKNIKDTTDFGIPPDVPIWDKIYKVLTNELRNNLTEYVKKYSNMISPEYNIFNADSQLVRGMQIQKYEKNTGKYVYHNDSCCDYNKKITRILTFIWYLNDVSEGGETEFWSNYKIKPKAGTFVLFPACWSFPHRGNVPISNNKYIITGWTWEVCN